jgi:hypothetical protein
MLSTTVLGRTAPVHPLSLIDDFMASMTHIPITRSRFQNEPSGPRVNITDTPEAYIFEVDALVIESKEPEATDDHQTKAHRVVVREYRHAAFKRRFKLGSDINGEGTLAHLEEGILTVTVPKTTRATPRPIEITTGSV